MTDISERVGFRYMTRFACIGSACEDPCCAGWTVPVDELHYRALDQRMQGTPEERAEFARVLTLAPPAVTGPQRFADMAMDASGRCPMFAADGLCTIQKRYGEDLLPNTCAIFPRSSGRIDARAELAATISCPEVARLCLLADDAVDLVPMDEAQFTRGLFNKQISTAAAEPYERRLEQVRAATSELMARPYPIASRLLFFAMLAHRTAGYFKRGFNVKDEHFDGVLAELRQPELLEQLHQQFAATDMQDPFALTVVLRVMMSKRPRRPTTFSALTDRVLGGYPGLARGAEIDLAGLWDAYRRRRDELPAAVTARIERYTHNYCINQLVKDWYIGWPTLVGYLQSLLVGVAVTRFLLIGHPDTARAAAAATPEELAAILDPAAVEAFYGFARAIQHDSALTFRVVESLEAQQMQTLAHSMSLLKA